MNLNGNGISVFCNSCCCIWFFKVQTVSTVSQFLQILWRKKAFLLPPQARCSHPNSPSLHVKLIHSYAPSFCKLFSSGKKFSSGALKGTQISELGMGKMLQLHMQCNLDVVRLLQYSELKVERISKFVSKRDIYLVTLASLQKI